MEEIKFKFWLRDKISKKVSFDIISRCKRVEKIFYIDLDEEYKKDCCQNLLITISNKNKKELPFSGRSYFINSYRYSIKKYCAFRKILENQ